MLESFDASAPSAAPEPAAALTIEGRQLSVAQMSLLAALKARRAEIAREKKLPAYVIFHDRTLIDMAQRAPRDLAQFAEVHGVGEAKIKAYGAAFLDVVARAAG